MRRLALALWLFIILANAVWAEPLLRVGVLRVHKPDRIAISCKSGLRIEGFAGSDLSAGPGEKVSIGIRGRAVDVSVGRSVVRRAGGVIIAGSGGCPVELVREGGVRSSFRGVLRVGVRHGALCIIDEVGLEDYVRGVLANEVRREWPMDALKAQAIAARTLAMNRIREHQSEGFDLCDTTHCQVYRGTLQETPETDAATRATSGEIITWRSQPIQALYCSCCGGYTAASYASQKLGVTPYLKAQKDILNGASACKSSTHFNWTYGVSASELAAALRSDSRTNPGAHFGGIRVIREDSSGRAVFVEIKGERTREIDGYTVWNILCRKLGWGSIKSARFKIRPVGSGYEFTGHGLGHGIGLCQWGANARAREGWSYMRILGFYYPGCKISQAQDEKFREMP